MHLTKKWHVGIMRAMFSRLLSCLIVCFLIVLTTIVTFSANENHFFSFEKKQTKLTTNSQQTYPIISFAKDQSVCRFFSISKSRSYIKYCDFYTITTNQFLLNATHKDLELNLIHSLKFIVNPKIAILSSCPHPPTV